MEIINNIKKFSPIDKSILTIGSYDGIHNGHLEVLSSLVRYSKKKKVPSVLITFNPHPRYIINNNSNLSLLMSMEEKIKIINDLEIDYLCIINFTKEFSLISPVEFLEDFVLYYFNPKAIFIGYNHHFGNNRKGSPELLDNFCKNRDIVLNVIGPVRNKSREISSTKIRELIVNGKIKNANSDLGSPYGFNAKVVRGSGRGESLTYPTANIIPVEKKQLMPKTGVYFICGRINGLKVFGMCNFGIRPTFNENDLVMEIHFFHKQEHASYGKEIRVEFLERIRDEKKFPSPEELINQLNIDKQLCLQLQGNYL